MEAKPASGTSALTQHMLALAMLCNAACGSDDKPTPSASPATQAAPAGSVAAGGAPGSCTLPSDCLDITTQFTTAKACCTPATACGYELPELDAETEMWFPDAKDFAAKVTAGDPNGRCAPSDFFIGPRPGLEKQRVEPDTGDDILITPDCESFTVLAFILPGCCMPDSTCGLSTHESYFTLEYLLGGTAPFTSPQCTSAETLNQQFRDSGTLAAFARSKASGSCDYAALAAELPPTP